MQALRAGNTLDKYRIQKKLADGGFAAVYKAYDTVEGISVALKVPHARHVSEDALVEFRNEARIVARLDHPHIVQLKNASHIGDRFVVVYPLGRETLGDRLSRRLTFQKALGYADQMLDAVAFAHASRIIHCDIKPENFILFEDDHLRLTDFGISKIALATRTIAGSGAGTVGYLAPEQAMGKPSFRSDVFSLSLVLFRMISGRLPAWPFEWPLLGVDRLRGRVHVDLIGFLQKGLQVDTRKRFADAVQMQAAFERIRPRVARFAPGVRSKRAKPSLGRDWKFVRLAAFKRQFGKELDLRFGCGKCDGPVSERMTHCPWCGAGQVSYTGPTRFPIRCERCERGMKKDWRFCVTCYGAGYDADEHRAYTDVRYTARCSNRACTRKQLMPFMRYCPWCRSKVRRAWKIQSADSHHACHRCGWGVLVDYWSHCPWCGSSQ
jgi:hypothetical protein